MALKRALLLALLVSPLCRAAAAVDEQEKARAVEAVRSQLADECGRRVFIEHHPVLRFVSYCSADRAAFAAFDRDLTRAMVAVRQMGLESLPISGASFDGAAWGYSAPSYNDDPRSLHLNIGSLPPRGTGPGGSASLVSLHEVGHAVLYGYLAARAGVGPEEIYRRMVDEAGVMQPAGEMFADVFAAVLMDDPLGMQQELDAWVAWERTLPPAVQSGSFFGLETTADLDGAERSNALRSFGGPLSRVCPRFDERDRHAWFDNTRRVIWQEVWAGRFHRDQASAGALLRGVAEELHLALESSRAVRHPGLLEPGGLFGQRGLAEVQGRRAMGEEVNDVLFTGSIRRRFGVGR